MVEMGSTVEYSKGQEDLMKENNLQGYVVSARGYDCWIVLG